MKRAAATLLILLLVLTGTVILGAGPILNSDPVHARLTTALERATGHQVRLGHVAITPGTLATLSPSITIEDAALLNPPGYSRPDLLSARRIRAVLSLPPLLSGRLHVQSFTVEAADALLERDPTGRPNWLPAAQTPAAPSTSQSRPHQPPELGPIQIETAHIGGLGLPPTDLRAITLSPSGGPITGTLLVNGVPLSLGGTWTPPGTFALTATGAGLTLALSTQPDGTLSFEANTPDLATASAMAGANLPHLQNATLSAHILPTPSGLQLRGLRLASAQGDAAGDLALTFQPRPALRGSLIAQQWNLDTWTLPPPPLPPSQPATTPSPTPTASPWLIPDRPIPFALLRRADADLHLAVNQATFQDSTYRSLETHLLLQDGHLRLDPLHALSPAGPLQAQLAADATAIPPTAALTLHGPGLNAAALAPNVITPGILAGTLDLDLDLHAAGPTWHAFAATLTGHAALSLQDGEVDNALLSRLFGPALRSAAIPLDAAGHSHLRCLILRTDTTEGQMHVGTLALDTTRLRLEGDGALDLGNETMDMHLRPVIRLGNTGITVPVHLTGPFRSPLPAADKGVLAPGRFGISIAQLGAQLSGAATPDSCAPK